jgi:hypothetical protein
MWAMGYAAPKPLVFPEAEGAVLPEGNNTPLHTCRLGEEGGVSVPQVSPRCLLHS